MNIAYISADFGVHILGFKGASIHVREMVTALHAQGHAICIFSPALIDEKDAEQREAKKRGLAHIPAYRNFLTRLRQHGGEESLSRIDIVEVMPDPAHAAAVHELAAVEKFIGIKRRMRQELRNLYNNLSLYRQAREALQGRQIDFIYERYCLFAYAGIRLARELGIPHILEVNAPLAYEQEKSRGLEMKELARDLEKQIYCDTDHVIVVSDELRRFVNTCGVPEERISVLPNGVDPARFSEDSPTDRLPVDGKLDGKQIIGFVGSLKPWHGTATLLEAFAQLHADFPASHLLIVGDGPTRESLERYAADAGIRAAVTFTGKVHYDAIPNYVAAMDITVAPYIPHENFYFSPIKIFEYMAMGKPVVAGRIGQVAEIIDHEKTGLLYEAGNVLELKQTLITLLQAEDRAKQIGEAARKWVLQERTWDRNARRVQELAEHLISANMAA